LPQFPQFYVQMITCASILACHLRASKPWVYLLSLSLLVNFLELKSSGNVSYCSLQFQHLSFFHRISYTDFMMNINYYSEYNLYPRWTLLIIRLHLHSCLFVPECSVQFKLKKTKTQ
jgi:hypothetical protein